MNNYVAVKVDGGIKGKGAFAPVSIAKNPKNEVCNEAVYAFLEHGIPLDVTIHACRDIRKFLTVRTVRDGAIRITHTNYDERLTPGKKRDVLLAAGWVQTLPGPLTSARFAPMAGEPEFDVEVAYRMHSGEDTYEYVGRVVRFYYAAGETRPLHYLTRNKFLGRNVVPDSHGARPCMELPDELPSDIDYQRYLRIAMGILKDVGKL